MRRSLTSRERVKRRADIKRLFQTAEKHECRGLKLLYRENSLSWNRVAFSPARKMRRAVDRNREKRVCRELYRERKPLLKKGFDLLFIIYPGEYNFSERRRQMTILLSQAGLES